MYKKRAIAAVTSLFIVFSFCGQFCSQAEEAAGSIADTAQAESQDNGYESVLENEKLQLLINKSNCKIEVIEKTNGNIWYSNPPEIDKGDDLQLSSQFILTYCNSSANEFTADSFTQSVRKKTFEVVCSKDTVTVTYTIGEEDLLYVFPKIISVKRMKKFLSNVSDEEAKYVLKYYGLKSLSKCKDKDDRKKMMDSYKSINDENDLYVVRGLERNKSQKSKVTEILNKAGYNDEELEKDNSENFIDTSDQKDKFFFSVPIVYKLENDKFVAYIDGEKLEYNKKFPLMTISLLPYFGASGRNDNGYIFVPDGSGALIYFNSKDTGVSSYKSEVYGHDNTFDQTTKLTDTYNISFPVFGMHYESKGLFAIIEDGEAFASINAGINTSTGYNYAFSEFNILPNTPVSLGDNLGTNKLLTYQKDHYKGMYKVSYALLGSNSTYSDMAVYYRNYLESNELIVKKDFKASPFTMNVIGSIDKTKSFLGIPYEGNVTLTTFDQCKEMIEKLNSDGIKSFDVNISGWLGGMRQIAPTSVNPLKSLGGKSGLSNLISDSVKNGVSIYPAVNFQYVWKNKLFDGFSIKKDSAVTLTGNSAVLSGYDIINGTKDTDKPYSYIVSPLSYDRISNKFTKSYKNYDNNYLFVDTLSSDLNSDHNKSNAQIRQKVIPLVTKTLKNLSDQYSLCGSGFNSYSLKYINKAINVPQVSNNYMLFSDSVPFLQMVVHGYIAYTGTPLNYSSVMLKDCLKAIETGSGIYVDWIYSDNSLVKNSNYDKYYSSCWNSNYSEIVKYCKMVEKALDGLGNVPISSHGRVAENVYKTSYDNGTEIYVNYNSTDCVINNITIGAMDYKVVNQK